MMSTAVPAQASVRFNLDPHDEYSDEEIWAVLAELEVRKLVEALPESLGTTVSEGGSPPARTQESTRVFSGGLGC